MQTNVRECDYELNRYVTYLTYLLKVNNEGIHLELAFKSFTVLVAIKAQITSTNRDKNNCVLISGACQNFIMSCLVQNKLKADCDLKRAFDILMDSGFRFTKETFEIEYANDEEKAKVLVLRERSLEVRSLLSQSMMVVRKCMKGNVSQDRVNQLELPRDLTKKLIQNTLTYETAAKFFD